MLDFIQWCEKKSYDLPAVDENTQRAGISQEYPDGYIRNQYPPAYFAPISATAYLDLKNAEKVRMVKGAGETTVPK